LSGLVTFVPGGARLTERHTGGTVSPRYCYGVWLRHLVLAARAGLPADPRVVAELGPGDTLGTGIAALLTGADRYCALDVVAYSRTEENLALLDAIHELFVARAPVPEAEFDAAPVLGFSGFPGDVLSDARVRDALAPARVAAIRAAVQHVGTICDGVRIDYAPDWTRTGAAPPEPASMIFSQAVLEHVDDLATTYRRMHDWLAADGFVSHEIDFTSHGFARTWDGHWSLSDSAWRIVSGKRRYAINREPMSTHVRLLEDAGFRIVGLRRVPAEPRVAASRLAPRFRSLSDADRATCNLVAQAVLA
jgi:hypothetical protein